MGPNSGMMPVLRLTGLILLLITFIAPLITGSGLSMTIDLLHSSGHDDMPVQVVYLESNSCLLCQQTGPVLKDIVEGVRKDTGINVELLEYELRSREGIGYARTFGIETVPAIIVDNGNVIKAEDYNGDFEKLDSMLRESIVNAARHNLFLEVTRSIVRDRHDGTILITTRVANNGIEPVNVTLTAPEQEGVAVVSGELSWNGQIRPGEERTVTCKASVDENIRSLKPMEVFYSDSSGEHTIIAPDVPLTAAKNLSAAAVFLAGLVAGINPCLLAVMAFIASMTLSARGTHMKVLLMVFAFCCGLLLIYLLMGLGFLQLMRYAPGAEGLLRVSLVSVLVLFGMWTFYDAYRTHIEGSRPSMLKSFIKEIKPLYLKFSLFANFILGMAFGLMKMPCVGGMYIAILGMLIDSGDAGSGMMYLVMYNLGVVSPVLIIGAVIAFGLSPQKVDSFRKHHRIFLKVFSGSLLILMAVGLALNII